MARNALRAKQPDQAATPRNTAGWLAALVILTLLATGTGAALGVHLVSTVEKIVKERNKAEAAEAVRSIKYATNAVVRKLNPIITNLAAPEDTWIRLEISIVLDNEALPKADVLAAEVSQDVLAFVRTLSLAQIAGASGLQHLREDLNDRAATRSGGLVREVIIETLVVQ